MDFKRCGGFKPRLNKNIHVQFLNSIEIKNVSP